MSVFSAGTACATDVIISVTGQSGGGELRMQLYGSEAAMQKEQADVASLILAPQASNHWQVTLHDISLPRLAVAAFQDRNGNQILDRSWVGLPSEPYGISMQQRKPDFAAASVELRGQSVTIDLQLR